MSGKALLEQNIYITKPNTDPNLSLSAGWLSLRINKFSFALIIGRETFIRV